MRSAARLVRCGMVMVSAVSLSMGLAVQQAVAVPATHGTGFEGGKAAAAPR
jgi:hypothetical protein